jgi:iron-sulfur cluster repair protein YtfE (RIC family)
MMELELSLKKIARSKKLQECLGHVPDNFHKQHRAELKEMAIGCLACIRK